jgi:O-antigen ligase
MIIKQKTLVLWTLIMGAVFIIPYASHPLTIDPVLSLRFNLWAVLTFFLLFLVTCIKSKTIKQYGFNLIPRPIFIVMAGFTVIGILSFTRSINWAEAVFDLQKVFLFFLFFYVVSIIASLSRDNVYLIAKSIVVSGIIFSIFGIANLFNNHLYSLMANKNLFSSSLFLMSPFVLFGLFNFSGLWRSLSLISAISIHCAIFLTGTRSVWLAVGLSTAAFVSTGLYYGNHWKNEGSNKKTIKTIVISGLLFIVSCTILFSMDQNSYSSVLSTKNLNKRVELWKNTIDMIKDYPVLGVGPGQWKINYPRYGYSITGQDASGQKTETVFQRPHNDYLTVLSEYGFPGFFFYIGFFIFILSYIIKILSHDSSDKTKSFALFMAYGIIGYMVISFFSFPKERIFHNIFLALISGSVFSIYHRVCPRLKIDRQLPIKRFHLGMMVILAFFIGTGFIRMNSEVHAKKMVQAVKSGKWDIAVYESDLADSLFYNMDMVSNPIPWYRGLARFSSGHIDDAVNDFKKALLLHPWHAHSYNNLGVCYANTGDLKKAQVCFQRAILISPFFKDAHLNTHATRQFVGNKRFQ